MFFINFAEEPNGLHAVGHSKLTNPLVNLVAVAYTPDIMFLV